MAQFLSDYIFNQILVPINYNLCLRNETSNVFFHKSETIFIRELKDDGITLEIPKNICQKGHRLTLFFLNIETNKKKSVPSTKSLKEALFEAIAKVESLEHCKVNKDVVFIDLQFSQFDKISWKNILKLYSKKQDEVNNLLNKQHCSNEKQ